MNYSHTSTDLSSYKKIGQGHLSSLQSNWNKPKAYINPQIVNCVFFRSPKLTGNKILVNPNFKGSGLHFSANSDSATSCYSTTIPLQTQEVKVNNISVNSFNNTSKFKKVNNISTSKNLKWSKEKNSVAITSSIKSNTYKYVSTPYKKVNQTMVLESPHRFTSKTKVINKLKTKLINISSEKVDQSLTAPLINKERKKYNFLLRKSVKSSALRIATSVRNKYKYIKASKYNYKIDKRKKVPEVCKSKPNKIMDIRSLFPKNIFYRLKPPFKNMYLAKHYQTNLVVNNVHSWRKSKFSNNITKGISNFSNKTVVQIGGILYKSTVNKLTIATSKNKTSDEIALISPKRKVKRNHHILYVRGEKFVLDKNGKTLKRQLTNTEENKMTPKRIDIGGVTYIRKSNNILVRTNVHQARHLVNKAKNKSIATLNKLYKKSSMPCMIFHKFGKCTRHAKGLCMYKHDIKNIAICKRFLKGKCDDEKCLLSHELIQEKMATCLHFLNGNCTRENCPFLHVKLNKNAAICKNFLHGFCNSGTNCPKRHIYICPEFEKSGKCSLGNKCQYPHKTNKKCQTSSTEQPETPQYYVKPIHSFTKRKSKKRKRALIKDRKDNKSISKNSETLELIGSHQNEVIECVPKRIKLDNLPCFIPLKSSF